MRFQLISTRSKPQRDYFTVTSFKIHPVDSFHLSEVSIKQLRGQEKATTSFTSHPSSPSKTPHQSSTKLPPAKFASPSHKSCHAVFPAFSSSGGMTGEFSRVVGEVVIAHSSVLSAW